MTRRHNGEGTIYPYRNGCAAQVWVPPRTVGGFRRPSTEGRVNSSTTGGSNCSIRPGAVLSPRPCPGWNKFATGWLRDAVSPNLAPSTVANYELFTRLYITPNLGTKRIDRLTVRDVRSGSTSSRFVASAAHKAKMPDGTTLVAVRPAGAATRSPRTRLGGPVDPCHFHRDFKLRAAKAGVPVVPIHSTRRTCASLLVALDVHPRVAMAVLRHSRIALSMEIYSPVSSTSTRDALKRLGSELTGP